MAITAWDVEWLNEDEVDTTGRSDTPTASATADYTIFRPASYSGEWTLQSDVGVNAVTDVTAYVWTEMTTERNWWLCL